MINQYYIGQEIITVEYFAVQKINNIGIGCVKNIPLFVGDLLIVLNRIFNYIRFEFFKKIAIFILYLIYLNYDRSKVYRNYTNHDFRGYA